MSKSTLNNSDQIKNLLKVYLETKNKLKPNEYGELETKFGTRGIKKISKNSFDNVIQQLKSRNFKMKEESSYYLNIKTDTVRTSINGIKNIQEYCRTNNISGNYPKEVVTFTEKKLYVLPNGSPSVVNYDDFNFRTSYSLETNFGSDSELVTDLKKNWNQDKKFYRLINRYSFHHEDYPLVVDLSIVRESKKQQNNLKESALFNLPEKYEIEIELKNDLIDDSVTPELLDKMLKKISKFILSGLQGTNYPISYQEQKNVLKNYLQLFNADKYKENDEENIQPRDFIGPSSTTLQISNITPPNSDSNIVNIRSNYTVTDKADGDRKMLYVSNKGKIYLITTLMEIEFTGCETDNREMFNSLLDGEHIKHNKMGEYINLYAAFDIYYINSKDIRELLFTPESSDELVSKFRLPLLSNFIKKLGAVLTNTKGLPPMNIQKKTFYATSDSQSLFQMCNQLQRKILADEFVYETDGFIFTPSNLSVGANEPGDKPKNYKNTWNYSLKWKPAKYNTIDFLATTKKTPSGQEYMGNVFEKGLNAKSLDQIVQYKTIVLRVGYDERKHGYINPCDDIYKDILPETSNIDDTNTYKPVQFFPSNPVDNTAGITNIETKLDTTNVKQMFTENNEIIEDNTIVEFRYDITREKEWRWIPLRVRYDKTAEYRSGFKQYGNAYHVAQSNWYSINNPITIDMLTTGNNIPDEFADDDVYYNSKKGFSHTKALRDFHNLFVKKLLITQVSKPGDTLIDYAVGKAGDLSKWIESNLSFVFGIDLSKDNIQNKIDGACARYLNSKKKFKIIPDGLFIQGNASENIKNMNALYSEKGKLITKAVFGEGPKDEKYLEKGILKSYGKGANGFNVSSIQFAIHYMFESPNTLHNFLTNISECTKLDGYFIGTSYDGKEIFNLLKDKKIGDSESIWDREQKNKLLEITKKYNNDDFPDNISSIGYSIDVFQESINKTFTEYLVNYDYLISVIENYGFRQLSSDEAKSFGIASGIGNFKELFSLMTQEIKADESARNKYGIAYKMTKQQKDISFLNKYFIFKKIRNVDVNDIKIGLIQRSDKSKEESYKKTLLKSENDELESQELQSVELESIKPETSITKTGNLTIAPQTIQLETVDLDEIKSNTKTEKPKPEKPEKTKTEKPEKTKTEKPEKTKTEKPEKTKTEKLEKTKTEKPEKTKTDKPEDTKTEKPLKKLSKVKVVE